MFTLFQCYSCGTLPMLMSECNSNVTGYGNLAYGVTFFYFVILRSRPKRRAWLIMHESQNRCRQVLGKKLLTTMTILAWLLSQIRRQLRHILYVTILLWLYSFSSGKQHMMSESHGYACLCQQYFAHVDSHEISRSLSSLIIIVLKDKYFVLAPFPSPDVK